MKNKLIGFVVGLVVTLPLSYLVLYTAGGGHGTYLPAKILFPWTMLCVLVGSSIPLPFAIAGLLQFPLYGLYVGSVYRSPRFRACVIALMCVHAVVSALVVFHRNDTFAHQPRQRPNQAMQLTASKLDVHAVSVCHPRFSPHRSHIGLAAADLVSR